MLLTEWLPRGISRGQPGMNLNESIIEDAALTWFGEFGYAIGHGPHLAPGEPAAGINV